MPTPNTRRRFCRQQRLKRNERTPSSPSAPPNRHSRRGPYRCRQQLDPPNGRRRPHKRRRQDTRGPPYQTRPPLVSPPPAAILWQLVTFLARPPPPQRSAAAGHTDAGGCTPALLPARHARRGCRRLRRQASRSQFPFLPARHPPHAVPPPAMPTPAAIVPFPGPPLKCAAGFASAGGGAVTLSRRPCPPPSPTRSATTAQTNASAGSHLLARPNTPVLPVPAVGLPQSMQDPLPAHLVPAAGSASPATRSCSAGREGAGKRDSALAAAKAADATERFLKDPFLATVSKEKKNPAQQGKKTTIYTPT